MIARHSARREVTGLANDAFRAIIIQGESLGSVLPEILVLLGVAAAGLVVSRLLFKVSQGGK